MPDRPPDSGPTSHVTAQAAGPRSGDDEDRPLALIVGKDKRLRAELRARAEWAYRSPSAPSGDDTVVSFPQFSEGSGTYRVDLTGIGAGAVWSERAPVAEGAPARAVSPNPTAGRARVAFAEAADVEVSVFDALGRRVAVAASGPHAAGDHEVTLDVSALAPGVYVVRVWTEAAAAARTLTVVR